MRAGAFGVAASAAVPAADFASAGAAASFRSVRGDSARTDSEREGTDRCFRAGFEDAGLEVFEDFRVMDSDKETPESDAV